MPEHIRLKRRKAEDVIANLPEDTPAEIIEHYLPEDETKCPKCGTQMEIIGKQEYKYIVIVPAQVILRIDVYYTYACKS